MSERAGDERQHEGPGEEPAGLDRGLEARVELQAAPQVEARGEVALPSQAGHRVREPVICGVQDHPREAHPDREGFETRFHLRTLAHPR